MNPDTNHILITILICWVTQLATSYGMTYYILREIYALRAEKIAGKDAKNG